MRYAAFALLSVCVAAQETEEEFAYARKSLVHSLMNQYRYAEAEKTARTLLAKAEAKLPPEALEIGRLQSAIRECITLLRQGGSDEALRLAASALRIISKHTGAGSAESMNALVELANVHSGRFEFDVSVRMLEGFIEERQRVEGGDPQPMHRAQLELAAAHYTAGAYGKAKRAGERAVSFAESRFGVESPEVAYALTPLSFSLALLGESDAARKAFSRSLAIRETKLGPRHRLTIASMNNLATHYSASGEFAKARELFERANAARTELLGPDNPDHAIGLHNLGHLLHHSGDFAGARVKFTEAMELRRKTIGAESYLYATAQAELARTLWRLNELSAAREHAEQALAVFQRLLSPEHGHNVNTLGLLAAILAAQGHNDSAFRAAAEAATRWITMTRLSAQTVPERLALAVKDPLTESGLGLATALAVTGSDVDKRDALDLWTRSRALVLDEMSARQKALNRAASPEAEALRVKMIAARSRVVSLALNGGPGLAEAKAERDGAEAAYAEQNRDTRLALRRARIGIDEVARQLKPGNVLVAYALAKRDSFSEARMAAFILQGGKAVPVMVPIGPVTEVNRLVKRWREAISIAASDPQRAGIRAETSAREAGAALRRIVYDPIAPYAGKATRVFLVAEGLLQLVNFNAFPAPDGRYIVVPGIQTRQ